MQIPAARPAPSIRAPDPSLHTPALEGGPPWPCAGLGVAVTVTGCPWLLTRTEEDWLLNWLSAGEAWLVGVCCLVCRMIPCGTCVAREVEGERRAPEPRRPSGSALLRGAAAGGTQPPALLCSALLLPGQAPSRPPAAESPCEPGARRGFS